MGIVEVAGELFGKGIELAGTVVKQAGDFASTAGLRAQILDKSVEHDKLMKELGNAVYETVKCDPDIVAQHEALFTRIAGVVAAKQELEDKLAEAEAAADANRPIDVDPIPPEGTAAAQAVKDAAAQVADRVKAAAEEAAQQVKSVVDEAAQQSETTADEAATAQEPAPEAPQAAQEAPAAAEPQAEQARPRVSGYRSATNAGTQEETE